MSGNVWEWVSTTFERFGDVRRQIRGGSWFAAMARVYQLGGGLLPDARVDDVGFRLDSE